MPAQGTSSAADVLVYAERLTSLALDAIADTTSLMGHPSILDVSMLLPDGWWIGQPPDGEISVPIKPAVPRFTATDEGTDTHDPTSIAHTKVSMTVADSDLVFSPTDALRLRDPLGMYNGAALAELMIPAYTYSVSDALVGLLTDFTASVGADDEAVTWAVVKEAQGALHISALSMAVGLVCILHPEQWVSVQADIAAAGGQIQFRADLVATQAATPTGYVGSYDGIDFFSMAAVDEPEEGTYVGGMFCQGAIGWLPCPQPPAAASEIRVLDVGLMKAEERRDAHGKAIEVIGAATYGVAILQQALGVRILGTGQSES